MKCGDCGSELRNKPICPCGWKPKPNPKFRDFNTAITDQKHAERLHMRAAKVMGIPLDQYLASLPRNRDEFLMYKETANWNMLK